MPGKSETTQLFLHGLEGQQRRACGEVQPIPGKEAEAASKAGSCQTT